MAGKKKIQSSTSKGREKLKAKVAEVTPKAKAKGRPGPKPKTKQVTGYTLLKRDENLLVKAYAKIEKEFDNFADALNELCYENGDKKDAATKTNQAALAVGKENSAFKKVLAKAKNSLKPIYS
jgi:hypothetical protein